MPTDPTPTPNPPPAADLPPPLQLGGLAHAYLLAVMQTCEAAVGVPAGQRRPSEDYGRDPVGVVAMVTLVARAWLYKFNPVAARGIDAMVAQIAPAGEIKPLDDAERAAFVGEAPPAAADDAVPSAAALLGAAPSRRSRR